MNVIRECTNPECRFRYPDFNIQSKVAYCPKCGANSDIKEYLPVNKNHALNINNSDISIEFQIVLDNIRSIYNVGAMFRTADGFGIRRIYLCGITPTPENPRFSKTGLMHEQQIPWEYHPNSLILLHTLKQEDFQIITIENTQKSKSLYSLKRKTVSTQVALIVGNESVGVDPEILRECDEILSIPMLGSKQSFNVAIALGIALSYFQSLLIL